MLKNYFNKEKFKKLFDSKGIDSLKAEAAPFRDWKILVISFFVGLSLSLAFNIYMSLQINNDSFFTATTQKYAGPVLNREGLVKVLADLTAKEAFLSKPTSEALTVVDPSR